MSSLADVTIGVTSFLRPGYLIQCIEGIRKGIPECQIIVADDSDIPIDTLGVECIHLPFDSGLPAKRNASVQACATKYWLCGCDDFDHSTTEARAGLEKMIKVLDENPDISVAGGRVHNHAYEGFLTYEPGSHIKETRLVLDGSEFQQVELTVNYFLARVADIKDIPWDERMKIGGEHGDWFLELKLQGKKVVWVKDVNINTLPDNYRLVDPRYGSYRGRAVNLGHAVFLRKRRIIRYLGFGD
jgi:hypothetical protein